MKKLSLTDILLPYQKEPFFTNKKRICLIQSRQIGKSFLVSYLLCYNALKKKNGLGLCISVNQNSAAEIIRKCESVARAIRVLSNGEITYTKTFDKIVFNNGSRIISLSSNPSSMRGYSADIVCIDEAAFIEHLDEVLQAINPTLTRNPDSILCLTTTPAGKNGPFYELYSNAVKDNNWFCKSTTIVDAISQGLKNVDIEQLKSLCPDPDIFNQEYMCCFNDSVNSLIDTNLLQTFEHMDIQDKDIFFGVDFGRKNDHTAITILEKDRLTEKLYLTDIVTLTNQEFEIQLDTIKQLFNHYEPKLVYVDGNGLGMPLAEDLHKFNTRIEGYNFTSVSKPESYENFRKLIFNKQLYIKHKFLKDIITDISQIRQTITESGKSIYTATRTSSGHADIFSSLVLGLEAARNTPVNIEEPFGYYRRSRLG